jgi:hypothetical protein
MELVRKLLFYFEEKPDFKMVKSDDIAIDGYGVRVIAYHIHIMCEADLLSCERILSKSTPERLIDAHPFRLTWQGHEFLDAARSDTIWAKAKKAISDKGISVAISTLQTLLASLAKQELGLQ